MAKLFQMHREAGDEFTVEFLGSFVKQPGHYCIDLEHADCGIRYLPVGSNDTWTCCPEFPDAGSFDCAMTNCLSGFAFQHEVANVARNGIRPENLLYFRNRQTVKSGSMGLRTHLNKQESVRAFEYTAPEVIDDDRLVDRDQVSYAAMS